jgi:hypothetical protein
MMRKMLADLKGDEATKKNVLNCKPSEMLTPVERPQSREISAKATAEARQPKN